VPKPTKKLRKLNWQKIPEKSVTVSTDSIWESMEKSSNDLHPNYEKIEELFAQKIIQKKEKKETKKAAPTEVSFVDSRRSLNINIFLKQFRLPSEKIIEALKNGDRDVLSEEKLKGMVKFIPEKLELENIKAYKGDPKLLASCDKYFLLLSQLPDYNLRIEACIARELFEEEIESIEPPLSRSISACKAIKNCKKLENLFLLILKTGNFMNHGAHSGGAYAFKFTSLLKLAETKSNKPRMTLLHVVMEEASKNHQQLLEIPVDLKSVVACRTVSVEQLKSDFTKLSSNIKKLERMVNKGSDDIKEQFSSFLTQATARFQKIEDDFAEVEKLRKTVAKYIVEDENKFKLEDCFSTISNFCNQIEKAIKENKEREIMEERKRKREAAMLEKQKNNPTGFKKKKAPPPSDVCIIDQLLGDIKRGFTLKKTAGPVGRKNSRLGTIRKSFRRQENEVNEDDEKSKNNKLEKIAEDEGKLPKISESNKEPSTDKKDTTEANQQVINETEEKETKQQENSEETKLNETAAAVTNKTVDVDDPEESKTSDESPKVTNNNINKPLSLVEDLEKVKPASNELKEESLRKEANQDVEDVIESNSNKNSSNNVDLFNANSESILSDVKTHQANQNKILDELQKKLKNENRNDSSSSSSSEDEVEKDEKPLNKNIEGSLDVKHSIENTKSNLDEIKTSEDGDEEKQIEKLDESPQASSALKNASSDNKEPHSKSMPQNETLEKATVDVKETKKSEESLELSSKNSNINTSKENKPDSSKTSEEKSLNNSNELLKKSKTNPKVELSQPTSTQTKTSPNKNSESKIRQPDTTFSRNIPKSKSTVGRPQKVNFQRGVKERHSTGLTQKKSAQQSSVDPKKQQSTTASNQEEASRCLIQ